MKRWMLILVVLFLGCSRSVKPISQPGGPAAWAPAASVELLGQPLDRLLQAKPGGRRHYATVPGKSAPASSGEILDVEYDERWFEMDKPVKTVYFIGGEAPPKVMQVTLNIPETESFSRIANQVRPFLGKPLRQGRSAPDSPSRYDASWKTGGLQLTLVDLDGPLELSILPAE